LIEIRILDPGWLPISPVEVSTKPEQDQIFGYRKSSIFGSGSSDGVIRLTSLLRDAAQEQAQMVRGYDETHVSILSNQIVIRKVYGNLSQPKQ
jgi:hypothetical protein